jgi:hypothetical protein
MSLHPLGLSLGVVAPRRTQLRIERRPVRGLGVDSDVRGFRNIGLIRPNLGKFVEVLLDALSRLVARGQTASEIVDRQRVSDIEPLSDRERFEVNALP